MDISKVLNEAELGALGEDGVARLESAYRAELAQAVKAESDRYAKKFGALVESVNRKVEGKISEAVAANVGRMKTDAINDKMYRTLRDVANLLEGVGIPCTEESKRLADDVAEKYNELKTAYKALQVAKDAADQEYKRSLIDALTAGCHPDVVQAAQDYFRDKDINVINKDTVARVISGDIEPTYPHEVDHCSDDEFNLDKVDAAMRENDYNFDLSVPNHKALSGGASARKKGHYMESIGKGLRAERVRVPKGIMEASAAVEVDDDVNDAMRQMAAFGELGLGGKFA